MGRHSIKKEKLFVTYKVLRCAMTLDDIVVLKDMFQEFEDVTETTNDDENTQYDIQDISSYDCISTV